MLKILEKNKEEYTTIILALQRVAMINDPYSETKKYIYSNKILRVTEIIFNEDKFSEIFKVCDEELNLFSEFDVKASLSKMTVHDDVKLIIDY